MYEELVKRLRYDAELLSHDGWAAGLFAEAADAIEERDKYALTIQHEMMAEAESHIALVERLNREIEELETVVESYRFRMRYGWIPVTKPPKEDGWYQVYAPSYSGGSSSGLKNIRGNMYSAFKNGKWSIEVGYHKRPGCVKAWMPLPEPPKEEAE